MEIYTINKVYSENFEAFRYLFSNCLLSDPIGEKVDFDGTFKKTIKFVDENKAILRKERIALMFFIRTFYGFMNNISDEFLWEWNTRLKKMLAIAIALESANLRSFGGKPTPNDVPQPITYLMKRLNDKKESFDKMNREYPKTVELITELRNYYDTM